MSEASKIRIRGLEKSFGPKLVLDGLDLDVGVGESVVVIGGKIVWAGPVADIDTSGSPYVDQFINGRTEGPIKMEVRAL